MFWWMFGIYIAYMIMKRLDAINESIRGNSFKPREKSPEEIYRDHCCEIPDCGGGHRSHI
jgi:hypothetical protein